MKMFRYTLLLTLALFSYSVSQAQSGSARTVEKEEYCTNYHREACSFSVKDIEWKYNSQSRSALFKPGQKSSFTFVANKGYDYRFTFGAEEKILQGQPLVFKVFEAKTKKPLFNSEDEGSAKEFEFSCDNGMNVLVEVEIPEGNASDGKKKIYGCVGFLMQSRKSPTTGF